MEQRLKALEDRLRANSSNSSTAPSSNPLWAPKLKPKKPTGQRPGGQKGHPGHHRELLPVEQVDEVVEHRPEVCAHCQASLAGRPGEAVVARHQVAELPARAVRVTEHQSVACRCARCGRRTTGAIPAVTRGRCTGARLDAALCYLSAYMHGSRRAIEDVAGEVLGLPLSLGTLVNREQEVSRALEGVHEQVQTRVRDAPAKHVDETGWRRAGRWLWVAATADAALFRVDRGRNWHGLQNLLGELVRGTVCSDRHGLYDRLKVTRRAVCWAHLKRDFQRWVDRGGEAAAHIGEEGLAVTKAVCALFARFRRGEFGRPRLRRLLAPLRGRVRELLAWGMSCGVTKARYFCRNVAKLEPALWTFARVDGVEPTNNHAERMLRPAVIWRKKCFGSHSAGGCRYVERMLTTIHTLRLRGRGVVGFLTDALTAHRSGLPSPGLC
jgi:transposase